MLLILNKRYYYYYYFFFFFFYYSYYFYYYYHFFYYHYYYYHYYYYHCCYILTTIIRKVRITIKSTDGTLKSWPYTTTVLSLLIVTSIVLLMSTVTVARILRWGYPFNWLTWLFLVKWVIDIWNVKSSKVSLIVIIIFIIIIIYRWRHMGRSILRRKAVELDTDTVYVQGNELTLTLCSC